jgi:uroporphyrinogen-III synthase
MRVLLTRPQAQSDEFGSTLGACGIDRLGEPLLRIVPVSWDPGVISGRAALLLTSSNAARKRIPVPGACRHMPVFAVGPDTVAPLQEAGSTNVNAAAGTAISLIA